MCGWVTRTMEELLFDKDHEESVSEEVNVSWDQRNKKKPVVERPEGDSGEDEG